MEGRKGGWKEGSKGEWRSGREGFGDSEQIRLVMTPNKGNMLRPKDCC